MAEYILNLRPGYGGGKSCLSGGSPPGRPRLRRTAHCDSGAAGTGHHPFRVAPAPPDLSRAPRLKWFQSMWAGTDEYLAPGVLPEGVVLTSSAGSNSQSVAEHALPACWPCAAASPSAGISSGSGSGWTQER